MKASYDGFDWLAADLTTPTTSQDLRDFAWGWHPLLVSAHYQSERAKIKHLAIELDFWRGTMCNMDETCLIRRFPKIQKLIIATGDLGERATYLDSGHWGRPCVRNGRMTPCCEGLFSMPPLNVPNDLNVAPRHHEVHLGDITFNPHCVQMDFRAIIDVAYTDRLDVPLREQLRNVVFTTMAVERGGVYWGHPSRLKSGLDQFLRLVLYDTDDWLYLRERGWSRDLEALIDY